MPRLTIRTDRVPMSDLQKYAAYRGVTIELDSPLGCTVVTFVGDKQNLMCVAHDACGDEPDCIDMIRSIEE